MMSSIRLLLGAILVIPMALYGDDPVASAAARVQQQTATGNTSVAAQIRLFAAQSLRSRHPELARGLTAALIQQLRASKFDPKLFRALLAQDFQKEPDAPQIFAAMVSQVDAVALDPADSLLLLNASARFTSSAPRAVGEICEKVLAAAASPDYGKSSFLRGAFRAGEDIIETENARDTLLLAAGARLHQDAPDRFEKFKPLLSRWDFSRPIIWAPGKSVSIAPGTGMVTSAIQGAPIQPRISTMRSLPTDADRARLAIELARDIEILPGGPAKLSYARNLASLSTEGDLGNAAVTAVAAALAHAIRDSGGGASDYIELAKLARYEHIAMPPPPDPALEAADALLALREALIQESGFNLTGLDGKTYSLAALRGRIVLLNFWATWCPPCRKEMPDMEKLYRAFKDKGLLVIAVSDEKRETVEKFLSDKDYTFPIALDPDRKVNASFSIEGIPKSFLFDATGKLVAESIDMRTEAQFREMLKKAGLE